MNMILFIEITVKRKVRYKVLNRILNKIDQNMIIIYTVIDKVYTFVHFLHVKLSIYSRIYECKF